MPDPPAIRDNIYDTIDSEAMMTATVSESQEPPLYLQVIADNEASIDIEVHATVTRTVPDEQHLYLQVIADSNTDSDICACS